MLFLGLDISFEDRCKAKWSAGRAERGLSRNAPFVGDPILEALGETPDLANYIDEAIKQGRIPEDVGRELIREVWMIDGALAMYR